VRGRYCSADGGSNIIHELHELSCGHLPSELGAVDVRELQPWPVSGRHRLNELHELRSWYLPTWNRFFGVLRLLSGLVLHVDGIVGPVELLELRGGHLPSERGRLGLHGL